MPLSVDKKILSEIVSSYLSRYSTSEERIRQKLKNYIKKWEEEKYLLDPDLNLVAEKQKALSDSEAVIENFKKIGALNDQLFSQNAISMLAKRGYSQKKMEIWLKIRGVNDPEIKAALTQKTPQDDFISALIIAQKRKIGPFSREFDKDEKKNQKALGYLLRSGFSLSIANRIFKMDKEEAENMILSVKKPIF